MTASAPSLPLQARAAGVSRCSTHLPTGQPPTSVHIRTLLTEFSNSSVVSQIQPLSSMTVFRHHPNTSIPYGSADVASIRSFSTSHSQIVFPPIFYTQFLYPLTLSYALPYATRQQCPKHTFCYFSLATGVSCATDKHVYSFVLHIIHGPTSTNELSMPSILTGSRGSVLSTATGRPRGLGSIPAMGKSFLFFKASSKPRP